jgi:hypothetical protein
VQQLGAMEVEATDWRRRFWRSWLWRGGLNGHGFGASLCRGLRCNRPDDLTPDEIAPVLKEALDHSGPIIVGLPVDYSDNHKLFEMVKEDSIH